MASLQMFFITSFRSILLTVLVLLTSVSSGAPNPVSMTESNSSTTDDDYDNNDSNTSMFTTCSRSPMGSSQCRGLIIGGSIGGFVLLVVILLCCWYVLRSNVRASESDSDSDEENSSSQRGNISDGEGSRGKLGSFWFRLLNCGQIPQGIPHHTPRVVEMSTGVVNANTPAASPLLPAPAWLRDSYVSNSNFTPVATPLLPSRPSLRASRIEPFAGFATVEQDYEQDRFSNDDDDEVVPPYTPPYTPRLT